MFYEVQMLCSCHLSRAKNQLTQSVISYLSSLIRILRIIPVLVVERLPLDSKAIETANTIAKWGCQGLKAALVCLHR